MPFGLRTRVGPGNHVLDGVQIPHGKGNFEWKGASYCIVYGHSVVIHAKMAEPIEMPFGLRTRVGPGNQVLDGGPDRPIGRGNFLG